MRLKGAITVFCSVTFLLVLSMIMGMLEAARVHGLQVRADLAVNGAMNSLFSMYYRPLFDRYGLLMMDGSFGTGAKQEEKIPEIFSEMAKADLSPNQGAIIAVSPQYFAMQTEKVVLEHAYYATDQGGAYFIRSVLDFMKYYEGKKLVSDCLQLVAQFKKGEEAKDILHQGEDALESEDWNLYMTTQAASWETEEETTNEVAQATDGTTKDTQEASGEISTEEAEETEITSRDYNQEVDDSLNQSILGDFWKTMKEGILALYGVDPKQVSKRKVDLKTVVSANMAGDASITNQSLLEDITEEILFDEYILSFLANYTGDLDQAPMKYEVEYVLAGNATDTDNLLSVLNKIYLTRLAMNSLAVLSMKERIQEAKDLANILVGWSGIAPLIAAVSWSLLEMLAMTESILDMRALLENKKVAFLKGEKDWTATFSNAISLLQEKKCAKENNLGLNYKAYLRVLLFLMEDRQKYVRTMDVIDWNLKKENKNFSLSNCIYAMEVATDIQSSHLFSKVILFLPDAILPKQYRWRVYSARSY